MYFTYRSTDYNGRNFLSAILKIYSNPPTGEYYYIENFGELLFELFQRNMLGMVTYNTTKHHYKVTFKDSTEFCILHYLIQKLCGEKIEYKSK